MRARQVPPKRTRNTATTVRSEVFRIVPLKVGDSPTLEVDGVAVPEPSSLTLLGIGAISLLGYGWRRRKRVTA